MALTGLSLKAATVIGPGEPIIPDAPKQNSRAHVYVTGNASVEVHLEGTLDGLHWQTIGTLSLASGGSQSNYITGTTGGGPNHLPFAAFRANLVSLSGGTNPTVSTFIALQD